MKKRLVFAVLALLTLFGGSTSTHAQFGFSTTFDPWNLAKNTLTAAESAKANITLASQYATQIQQYNMQLQQLKQLGDLNAWKAKVKQEEAAMANYIASLTRVHGDLTTQNSRLLTRLNEAKAAGLTFEQYQAQRARRAKEGDDDAIRSQRGDLEAIKRIDEDYKQVQVWESAVKDDMPQGTSQRILNQQMNRVITQNASLAQAILAERIEKRDQAAGDRADDHSVAQEVLERQNKTNQRIQDANKKSLEALKKYSTNQ